MLLTTWDSSLGPAQPLPQEQPAGRSGVGGARSLVGLITPGGAGQKPDGPSLAGKGSPSLQGILAEQSQQGILLRKPSHRRNKTKTLLFPPRD